jgi:hypothetical protein
MDVTDYYIHNPKRRAIEKRLNILIQYPLDEEKTELIAFQNRLSKYRDFIFTFLLT